MSDSDVNKAFLKSCCMLIFVLLMGRGRAQGSAPVLVSRLTGVLCGLCALRWQVLRVVECVECCALYTGLFANAVRPLVVFFHSPREQSVPLALPWHAKCQ